MNPEYLSGIACAVFFSGVALKIPLFILEFIRTKTFGQLVVSKKMDMTGGRLLVLIFPIFVVASIIANIAINNAPREETEISVWFFTSLATLITIASLIFFFYTTVQRTDEKVKNLINRGQPIIRICSKNDPNRIIWN